MIFIIKYYINQGREFISLGKTMRTVFRAPQRGFVWFPLIFWTIKQGVLCWRNSPWLRRIYWGLLWEIDRAKSKRGQRVCNGRDGGIDSPDCENSALDIFWRSASQRASLTRTGERVYRKQDRNVYKVATCSNLRVCRCRNMMVYSCGNMFLVIATCFY